MEVLVAVAMFALVGTAMVVALNSLSDLAFNLHRKQQLARILDSELTRALSLPNIEEGVEKVLLEELGVEIETVVSPIVELENQEGQALANMFRITVSAYWEIDGENQEESTETWRYASLYRQ